MQLIITLIIMGIILLLIEIIIPGGIIGILGVFFILAGIALGFSKSTGIGIILLFSSAVAGLICLWISIKYFPKSKVGKQLFLDQDAKDWQAYEESNQNLLGKSGISHTQLKPSGIAIFDNKRIDVITQGEHIENNEKIRVVKVEGNRVIVSISEQQL